MIVRIILWEHADADAVQADGALSFLTLSLSVGKVQFLMSLCIEMTVFMMFIIYLCV